MLGIWIWRQGWEVGVVLNMSHVVCAVWDWQRKVLDMNSLIDRHTAEVLIRE